jgi:thiol-disulfide isomerase/thioredoxin
MIELVEDKLQDVIAENQRVVVQFSASWCGNCRLIKPKFRRLSEENQSAAFVYVDAEKFPESRKLANVTNLPTFAIYHNGVIVKQIQTNKEENLKELVYEITNH